MVTVVEHPLAQHLLTQLRDVRTEPDRFRDSCKRLSMLLILEATRSLTVHHEAIETPLEGMHAPKLNNGIAIVPILRAGLGMLDSALDLFPDVAVGYIGLERAHDTAIARSYYCKLPNLSERTTLCVDPMLATGGSASQALSLLKGHGAKTLHLISVVSTPEGISRIEKDHPDVAIVTAAIDRELDENKYIRPGLGDFGDRLFGTM